MEKEQDFIKTKESISDINWVKPNFNLEEGEIRRTAMTLAGDNRDEALKYLTQILEALSNGYLESLSDELWSNLENTDSWEKVEPGSIDEVRKISDGYNKNFKGVYNAILEGKEISAPIILIKPNRKPYLISGNTRLMIARALAQRPRVWIAELK